jgi:hypothetical protein
MFSVDLLSRFGGHRLQYGRQRSLASAVEALSMSISWRCLLLF